MEKQKNSFKLLAIIFLVGFSSNALCMKGSSKYTNYTASKVYKELSTDKKSTKRVVKKYNWRDNYSLLKDNWQDKDLLFIVIWRLPFLNRCEFLSLSAAGKEIVKGVRKENLSCDLLS